ncbi:MAG: helix-turn-helix domain-containing protein [Oscillospiraceae bacterium]|nr:helix-turn-helix domain-containing protein [Oscillospiraceae bacterium]
MPKVTWISQPKPKVNELAALFRAYRKARNMTSDDIGKAVGCTPQNARYQMNKPGTDWNIGQLLKYCDVLGIPYEDAFKAAIQ